MNNENKLIGLPIFEKRTDKNSFLLKSRSAFASFKFRNESFTEEKNWFDDEVKAFVLNNKHLSLDEFTEAISKILVIK